MKSVAVITPTTCSPDLIRCMDSVAAQTYENVTHHVIVDGLQFYGKLNELANNSAFVKYTDPSVSVSLKYPKAKILLLNDNTGANGFYGHRIFAGIPHLLNEDYIFLLDSDNTYEPDHIETMVETLEKNAKVDGPFFAYSLRNIYDKEGKFLAQDDCESLGHYPVWNDPNGHLVDTSAYAFRKEFLIRVSHLWHRGYAGDRMFFADMQKFLDARQYVGSGKYTMNYYLGSSETSPAPEFFQLGNAFNKQRYAGRDYPWRK